jgi:hypothetical protein
MMLGILTNNNGFQLELNRTKSEKQVTVQIDPHGYHF